MEDHNPVPGNLRFLHRQYHHTSWLSSYISYPWKPYDIWIGITHSTKCALLWVSNRAPSNFPLTRPCPTLPHLKPTDLPRVDNIKKTKRRQHFHRLSHYFCHHGSQNIIAPQVREVVILILCFSPVSSEYDDLGEILPGQPPVRRSTGRGIRSV